jgi:adenine/guanine phosphoribosyltransferase-like PRPP-binding protein
MAFGYVSGLLDVKDFIQSCPSSCEDRAGQVPQVPMDSQDLYYRSVDDLNRLVRMAALRLPGDIDLIVGIPRSGLLVANLLALHMHVPMATLGGFARGEVLDIGSRFARRPATLRKVLVVDDSVSSGVQLRAARDRLAGKDVPLLFAAAYCTPEALPLVDFAFEVLPQPRAFEWNILNGELLRNACVALDAIKTLGRDGPARHFQYPIGHVVCTEPEARRAEIQALLDRRGIACGRLWLAPDGDASGPVAHLADSYRRSGAQVLIVAGVATACRVADASGRAVFAVETMQMAYPGRAPGMAMTFAGPKPPNLRVPLTWFVRQAAADIAGRLFARRQGLWRGPRQESH